MTDDNFADTLSEMEKNEPTNDFSASEASFVEACQRIETLFFGLHFFVSPSRRMPPTGVLEAYAEQDWKKAVRDLIDNEMLRRVGALIAAADSCHRCDVKPLRKVVRKLRGLKQVLPSVDLSTFLASLEDMRADVRRTNEERMQALERMGYETIEIQMPAEPKEVYSSATSIVPPNSRCKVSSDESHKAVLKKIEDPQLVERYVLAAMVVCDSTDINILRLHVNNKLAPEGMKITKQQVRDTNCHKLGKKGRQPKGSKVFSYDDSRDAALRKLADERTAE